MPTAEDYIALTDQHAPLPEGTYNVRSTRRNVPIRSGVADLVASLEPVVDQDGVSHEVDIYFMSRWKQQPQRIFAERYMFLHSPINISPEGELSFYSRRLNHLPYRRHFFGGEVKFVPAERPEPGKSVGTVKVTPLRRP